MAAIAVPDVLYGEVVGAWVIPRTRGALTRAAVRAHVNAAMNPQVRPARHTVVVRIWKAWWADIAVLFQNAPTWVWFVGEDAVESEDGWSVPDELPKTASGKVMKHVLRQWARALAADGVGRVATESGKSKFA